MFCLHDGPRSVRHDPSHVYRQLGPVHMGWIIADTPRRVRGQLCQQKMAFLFNRESQLKIRDEAREKYGREGRVREEIGMRGLSSPISAERADGQGWDLGC